jgi:prepilin-type N-terminal cleavage/methylation domain-containing protein
MKASKPGFTLIELLVVIAIITLLMGILMPALSRVKESARRAVCSSQVRQIGTGMTAYTIDKLDSQIPYMTDLLRYKKDELSHKRQGSYAVNAAFKDRHVELCNNERVFNSEVWDQMKSGAIDELPGNYIVFQMIGGRAVDYGL